jgi:RHS repeat-associated protein
MNVLYNGRLPCWSKDALGSVRSRSNEDGQLEDRYEYDAFGKPYKGDLNSGVNLGYTGKPYDTATGMYNYGYRDYQPEVARFTTVDPIRDGSNWFAYVNNDPVNWVDPLGLQCISASDKNATAKAATASGIGLIAAGLLLGAATILEDLVPVGGGILNDPVTLSTAGGLISAGIAQIGASAVISASEANRHTPDQAAKAQRIEVALHLMTQKLWLTGETSWIARQRAGKSPWSNLWNESTYICGFR